MSARDDGGRTTDDGRRNLLQNKTTDHGPQTTEFFNYFFQDYNSENKVCRPSSVVCGLSSKHQLLKPPNQTVSRSVSFLFCIPMDCMICLPSLRKNLLNE